MGEWKRKSMGGSNFLRFQAGSAHEGVFKGMSQRPNPFKEGTMITDVVIEQGGEDKVLSTSSEFLVKDLADVDIGANIRIEMTTKGIKKLYTLYVEE